MEWGEVSNAVTGTPEGEDMEEKTLWEVTADITLYVMAEDEDDAIKVAMREGIKEETDNLCKWDLSAFQPNRGVMGNWVNLQPYNSDDNRTVGEIWNEMEGKRKQRELYEEYLKR